MSIKHRVAFVLGGADTLYGDMSHALTLTDYDCIIGTNDAGRDWSNYLDHWCTLHTEKMGAWVDERKSLGYENAGQLWTSNKKTIPKGEANWYKHVESWDGSSGLLAITVAISLGYEKIILCGVPLDKKAAHYFCDEQWLDAPRYRAAWTKNLFKIKGKVKSNSGWTKLILGGPSEEWLD